MTLHPIKYKKGIIYVDKEAKIKSGDKILCDERNNIMNTNNNIEESYCSFEVCKLLKEKGFTVLCNKSFNPTTNEPQDIIADNCVTMALARPTQTIAVKWLRENFKIIISAVPFTIEMMDDDIHPDESEDRLWSYYIHMNRKFINDGIDFSSFEAATEEALLYTLKNLI